jgi:anti-sigma28 factor (negative regulator of flagellin synthesis)
MTINHVLPSQVRASGIQRPKGEGNTNGKDESDSVSSGGRSDRVEISPEGRILSTQAQSSLDEVEDLSQEQVTLIRQRIQDGTYDSPEVAEEVARQLLNTGDLSL